MVIFKSWLNFFLFFHCMFFTGLFVEQFIFEDTIDNLSENDAYIRLFSMILFGYMLTYFFDFLLREGKEGPVYAAITFFMLFTWGWGYFGEPTTFLYIFFGLFVFILVIAFSGYHIEDESIKRGWCHRCDKAVDYTVEHYGNSDYGHITCPECGKTTKNASLGNSIYSDYFNDKYDLR